jgi:hypothetical protein
MAGGASKRVHLIQKNHKGRAAPNRVMLAGTSLPQFCALGYERFLVMMLIGSKSFPNMIDLRSSASELTHRVAAKDTILVHHFKALNQWVARAVLREFLAPGTRISARLQNSRLSQTLEVPPVKETCAHV